jgi:hypothetical protein
VADAVQLSELSDVFTWLQPRAANNTVVQTVQQALGNGGNTDNQPPPADKTAPTSSIACNGGACGAWYTSAPSVALSATDTGGSGVAAIRYTTNGSDPTTSSTLYTGPITVNSTSTLKYRAWDAAGNVEATHTVTIGVDSTAPTTTLRCNNTTCSTGWYAANVTASLSATDSGGSGLSAIRYTTNGSAPTTSSTVFTSPFTLTATTTVSYRAWDVAGNVESTKQTSVRIDKSAPIVVITSPLPGATVTGNATVSATATDIGGSGIASVAFKANGTTFATDTTSPYSVTWPTAPAGNYTLTATATDVAGNATTSPGVTVRR